MDFWFQPTTLWSPNTGEAWTPTHHLSHIYFLNQLLTPLNFKFLHIWRQSLVRSIHDIVLLLGFSQLAGTDFPFPGKISFGKHHNSRFSIFSSFFFVQFCCYQWGIKTENFPWNLNWNLLSFRFEVNQDKFCVYLAGERVNFWRRDADLVLFSFQLKHKEEINTIMWSLSAPAINFENQFEENNLYHYFRLSLHCVPLQAIWQASKWPDFVSASW